MDQPASSGNNTYTPSAGADNRTLWFCRRNRAIHLYLTGERGNARPHLGSMEATRVQWSSRRRHGVLPVQPRAPGRCEVCAVDAAGNNTRGLDRRSRVSRLARRRTAAGQALVELRPAAAAAVGTDGNGLRTLTDTHGDVPHVRLAATGICTGAVEAAGTVWGKYLGPQAFNGSSTDRVVRAQAGYLQNVSDRYPAYFREQMFHNRLVQQGYRARPDFRVGGLWPRLAHRDLPPDGAPELEDWPDARLAGRTALGDAIAWASTAAATAVS